MSEERLKAGALLDALESGELRVAEPGDGGVWTVNAWVKEELLEIFRQSPVVGHLEADCNPLCNPLGNFVDKEAFPVRRLYPKDHVRVVPGGSSIRRGAFVAPGVICMPPMYINVGAYVGVGTMIDSHALVGSCAQIGEHCHISAATQIGGVLEPAGARPVIIEDEVFVGGNCGIYEGVLVRRGAVIAAGVVLTAGTPVFDLVNERELRGSRAEPVEIPENAVVVPGSRPVSQKSPLDLWATHRRLHIDCALIVKYRDESTDRATALEHSLR